MQQVVFVCCCVCMCSILHQVQVGSPSSTSPTVVQVVYTLVAAGVIGRHSAPPSVQPASTSLKSPGPNLPSICHPSILLCNLAGCIPSIALAMAKWQVQYCLAGQAAASDKLLSAGLLLSFTHSSIFSCYPIDYPVPSTIPYPSFLK